MATKTLKRPESAEDLSPESLAKRRWLTPRQTCAYLQVSRNTLNEMLSVLPHSRPTARVIRFDREQLDEFLSR